MPRISSLFWLLPLTLLASCTAFDTRFDALGPTGPTPAAPVAGKWEGTWQSDKTTYDGHLKAIIVPTDKEMVDNVEVQDYRVDMEQRVFEIVPTRDFSFKLVGTPMADGRIHIVGKKDLGYYFGGIFRFDGYVDPKLDKFYCDYTSEKDAGTFKMSRISAENQ